MKTADYAHAKRDPVAWARMQSIYELYDFAVKTMRLNLRRRHPDATDEEIADKLRTWLLSRPDAPLGDADGCVPSDRFRDLME